MAGIGGSRPGTKLSPKPFILPSHGTHTLCSHCAVLHFLIGSVVCVQVRLSHRTWKAIYQEVLLELSHHHTARDRWLIVCLPRSVHVCPRSALRWSR